MIMSRTMTIGVPLTLYGTLAKGTIRLMLIERLTHAPAVIKPCDSQLVNLAIRIDGHYADKIAHGASQANMSIIDYTAALLCN